MINPGIFNPGYIDLSLQYSGTIGFRRQWLRQIEMPKSIAAFGHYHINEHHGVGIHFSDEIIKSFNQLDLAVNYAYHFMIDNAISVGMGIKVGMLQQAYRPEKFTYFDFEPILEGTTNQIGLSLGTGISVESESFNFNVALPYIFGNKLPSDQSLFGIESNHAFVSAGYKFRPDNWFVVYPTTLVKMVQGAPVNVSLDMNFLFDQLIWAGIGYRNDHTLTATAGLFFYKGLRAIYSFDTAALTKHFETGISHEFTISYAQIIQYTPFSRQRYNKKALRRRR
jgi:type IX secretion system PorP/SprF family membrane protein